MKAYKVVTVNENGDLVSACIDGANRIQYHPGKWTPKRKYGSFVFSTLKEAQDFMLAANDKELWECETSDDLRHLNVIVNYYTAKDCSRRQLLRLMDDIMGGGCPNEADEAVEGTMMASSIKLTKKLKETLKKNRNVYPTFKTAKDYQKHLRKGGLLYDEVEVENTVFTMDGCDVTGRIIYYGNKRKGLSMNVGTNNRYQSKADAHVEIFSSNVFRNDITYAD